MSLQTGTPNPENYSDDSDIFEKFSENELWESSTAIEGDDQPDNLGDQSDRMQREAENYDDGKESQPPIPTKDDYIDGMIEDLESEKD